MNLENKKDLITATVLFSLVLGFVLIGFYVVNEQDKLLEENPVYSFAIIVDTYVGSKARPFVRYEFVVNGKIYDGHQGYMRHRQTINVGDTVEVVYAGSNPEISRLLTDENNYLKKRYKNIEWEFLLE